MTTKTYQSTEFMKLVLNVEINAGIPVECVFTGGKYFPYRENGTYRTSNKAIQEAIESHPRYPGDFKLIKTVEDAKEPVKTPEPPKEVTPVVPPTPEPTPEPTPSPEPEPTPEIKTPEPPKATADGTILVSEVKNSQEAKLYLNKNFDVPFSRLKNVEMVMKETKIANLNFPNWKL